MKKVILACAAGIFLAGTAIGSAQAATLVIRTDRDHHHRHHHWRHEWGHHHHGWRHHEWRREHWRHEEWRRHHRHRDHDRRIERGRHFGHEMQ